MASAKDKGEEMREMREKKNWSEAEWDKHMPSFKNEEGDKYKVNGVVYERERDAIEALITKLTTDVPARGVMETVPLTTKYYIDYCLPPKGNLHQQSECINQEILNDVNINDVLRHIQRWHNESNSTVHLKIEVIKPLIKSAIRHKNADTKDGRTYIQQMFNMINNVYGMWGRELRGDERYEYLMIDEETVKIALKYNNVQAMSQIISLSRFEDGLTAITLKMIENDEMQPLIEELVNNKHYKMLETIFGSVGWGINLRPWLDPSTFLTPQQTKKLLTVPIEIINTENCWNDEAFYTKSDFLNRRDNIYTFFFKRLQIKNVDLGSNVDEQTSNRLLLKHWEHFIRYLLGDHFQWKIKSPLLIEMIQDNTLTDEVIRFLWFMLLWVCDEENLPGDHHRVDPADDNPFVGNELLENIENIFIAILTRIQNNTDSSDLKGQKATFFLKAWKQYPNISRYISHVPVEGITLYNRLVGHFEFHTFVQ